MTDAPKIGQWIDRLTSKTIAITYWRQRAFLFADSIVKLEPDAAAIGLDNIIDSCFTVRDHGFKLTAEAAMTAMLFDIWEPDHRGATAAAAVESQATLADIFASQVDASASTDDVPGVSAPDYGGGRPLTLGERRSIAIKPNRKLLERAVTDPHPMVVKKLLDNPRLTEDNVVRMAARRPAQPAALVEIALHPRWRSRRRPALALTRNPALPPGVGLTLLPGLYPRDVEDIAVDLHLDPLIRMTASELVRRAEPPEETQD